MEKSKPMRTPRKIILLLIGWVLTSGCNGGANPQAPILPEMVSTPNITQNSNVATSDSLCNNPLLPAVQGATWLYYSTGGPNGDFAYSDTISDVKPDSFILTSQFDTNVLTQQWVCTPDGLRAMQLGGGTVASISMQHMIADFKTLEVSGVILPNQISPGMQWQYNIKMEGSMDMPGEQTQSPGIFSLTLQEVGQENITVPAGSFDAIKIQATFNAQINADFQGSPVPYTINGSSILWYAPHIGLIKSIENIDFSGTAFTSTTELQTYQMP